MNYCQNDLDILYFYLKLKHCGNPELTLFCAEGQEFRGGFDVDEYQYEMTDVSTPIISTSSSLSSSDSTINTGQVNAFVSLDKTQTPKKRVRDNILLEISKTMKEKAAVLKTRESQSTALQAAILKKAKWEALDVIETRCEELENAPNYNSEFPSERLQIARDARIRARKEFLELKD